MVSIDGRKIRLRAIRQGDLETYRHWNQPGQQWQALDGPYYPPMTVAEVDELIEKITARIVANDWPPVRTRLVIADRADYRLVGMVSRYWISEETNWAALGIVIYDPANWGQGIGYEALGLWTDYLFQQQPDWVRLDLRTWSGNHGMMRLAEKLGYQAEARFRNARIVDGDYYDGLGYGVLRTEWQDLYPAGFRANLMA